MGLRRHEGRRQQNVEHPLGEEKNPTLILSPRFSSDSNKLWKAAVDRKWNIHRAYRFEGPVAYDRNNDVGFVYGERYFCDILAGRMDLGLLDPPDDWLPSLPEEFRKRKVLLTTVENLWVAPGRTFIKPANDKVFEAGIYERGMDVPVRYIDPDCPILLSEIVEFVAEVRLVILDRQVLTGAYYRLVIDKDPEELVAEAIEWVKPLLALENLNLPSAVVVDVGIIEGRGWAVVEANQLYSSGLYDGMVLDKVLDAVVRAAGPMPLVRPEDRKYLRNP